MVIDSWSTGDIIAEIQINNRGIRKGTVGELDGIAAGSREDGIYLYNTTDDIPQVLSDTTNNLRGNMHTLLGADATETAITGTTATQVKDLDFIISDDADDGANMGFAGNFIWVVATLKASANTANLRVRFDAIGTDRLLLTTSSTSYTRVQGKIPIGPGSPANLTRADGTAAHVLKIFLDNSTGGSITTLQNLEIYGI